jgi:hypothetical protein
MKIRPPPRHDEPELLLLFASPIPLRFGWLCARSVLNLHDRIQGSQVAARLTFGQPKQATRTVHERVPQREPCGGISKRQKAIPAIRLRVQVADSGSGRQTRTVCAHLHHSGCNRNFDEICSTTLESWCREGELNPQGAKHRRILSPLRLPVPPSRLRKVSSSNSAIYCRPAVIGCTRLNRWDEFSRQLNSAVQCKYRIAPALAPTELRPRST